MNLAAFGETFRNARLAANLTQQAVAAKSGVSRHRISLFETGTLPEIGAVRMLNLFDAVGLQLIAQPSGQKRARAAALHEAGERAQPQPRKRVRMKAPERVETPLEA
ncbi:helix-turn-helix domain-containing protein [Paraburkholderia youngii]|uniref:helix-turn-helix domain-containing protein n=1 Tax=Paraburkholderia youngii TaxID=2782701 RepID=UPI003D2366F6